MTDARMALIELIEKRADTDLVRAMLAFAAERLMELEVGPSGGRVTPPPSGNPSRSCAGSVRARANKYSLCCRTGSVRSRAKLESGYHLLRLLAARCHAIWRRSCSLARDLTEPTCGLHPQGRVNAASLRQAPTRCALGSSSFLHVRSALHCVLGLTEDGRRNTLSLIRADHRGKVGSDLTVSSICYQ